MFGSALNRYTDSIAVDSSKSNLKLANETEKGEKRQSFSFNFGITKDFLDNTSLHGLKFIGLTHITMFERMFFGLSFVLVLFCSGYFISNVFIRWSTAPIIVTVGPTNMLIPDMPFPAVTVCNLNKARNSVIHKLSNGSTGHEILKSVCYDEYENITTNDTWNGNSEWGTVRRFLLDISQPCQEMLRFCRFGHEPIYCMSLFDTILTDEGLCCSFNPVEPEFLYKNPLDAATNLDNDTSDPRLIPVDWTPEKGYVNQSIRRMSIPRPAPGTGRRLGLHLVLNADVPDYFCSSTNSFGFKILLHNPVEMPQISYYGMLLHPGRETQIIITPKISTASYRAHRVPIASRGCIFSNEIQLKFFRTYSRKNCEMECFSQAIEQECGCVIYYMPRMNQQSKICTRASSDCYNPLRISIERREHPKYKCQCYPACDELSYSGAISTTPLIQAPANAKSSLKNFSMENIRRDIAVVEIFYKNFAFETFQRDELIGFTEFLSNTGGLLGLFMGFSVVSLIEIFYFIALRSYCSRHTNKNASKMKLRIAKSNSISDVTKLTMQNQTCRHSRMNGRAHLLDNVYRRNY